MKLTLKNSILLNLALVGCLIIILAEKQKTAAPGNPLTLSEVRPPARETTANESLPDTREKQKSFRWSQLAGTNYPAYIKNLRAVGCPESTLRAIVVADVNKNYDAKYQELAQQLTALATNSWSAQLAAFPVQQALKGKLQKLPGEEAAEIAALLGWQTAAATTIPASSAQSSQGKSPALPIVMPLIFQAIDPQTLNLNHDQVQAIAMLRQQFWNDIGGPDQDPSDPAYRERWQRAQPEMDDLLRGMIGTEAFQNYQLEALARKQVRAAQP